MQKDIEDDTFGGDGASYLLEAQQAHYLVTVNPRNGLDRSGRPFDTSDTASIPCIASEFLLWNPIKSNVKLT